MAIQFSTTTSSDNYSIATPSNSIGGGQSAMSAHCAFQISAPLTNTSGMFIFGQGGITGFFIELFTSLGVNVADFTMESTGGQSGTAGFQLAVNVSYFIDLVWTSGAQSLYINGVHYPVGTQTGTTTAGAGVRVGCPVGSTGLGLTISNVAVWDGYALTQDDVVNLMTATYTPLNLIGSGDSMLHEADWHPTLAGTLGHAPQAGDAGLLNSGAAGNGSAYNLSSFTKTAGGSAQYVAELTWTAVPMIGFVNSTGQAITFAFTSPTGLPTTDTSLVGASATLPTVTVTHADTSQDTPTLYGPVWSDYDHDLPFAMYQLLTGGGAQYQVVPTDVVTYTLPFGTLTTSKLGPNGPFTNATAINCTGTYEPAFNGLPSSQPTPTMGQGYCSIGLFYGVDQIAPARNLRLRLEKLGGVTYDVNNQPLYWTPGAGVSSQLWANSQSNSLDKTQYPTPIGVFSIVFEDANALSPTNHLKVWLTSGNAGVVTGTDTTGPATGTNSTYVRTVVANGATYTVTVSYWIQYVSIPNVKGYNVVLTFNMSSASGYFSQAGSGGAPGSGPIGNFWIFGPGDSTTTVYDTYSSATSQTTAPSTTGYASPLPTPYTGPFPNANGNDRSDPLAMSAYLKLALTSSNGNGPATLRSTGFQQGLANWLSPPDLTTASLWSFGADVPVPGSVITVSQIRAYNPNPNNSNYAWYSRYIYHPLLGFDGNNYPTVGSGNTVIGNGYREAGNYLDLSLHPAAQTNELTAAWLGYCEVYYPGHPYRSGEFVYFPVNNSIPHLALTGGPNVLAVAAVTNKSTTVTFASTITIPNNTTFYTSAGGAAYKIATGGTGTTFTLSSAYQGDTSPISAAYLVCSLTGTASVTNGSTSVTFSTSQTIANGAWLSFTGSTQAYLVATGGTGTSFTISPAFQGATNGTATTIPCGGAAMAGTVSVTNNSYTITFSQPQVLAAHTYLTLDSSGLAYLVAATALSGTASVTNGSTSVTFSTSQTIANNTWFTFADPVSQTNSGQYLIATGGTGTTFTFSTLYNDITATGATATPVNGTIYTLTAVGPYLGTTNGTATATVVSSLFYSQHQSIITVTGPDTFVFTSGLADGTALGGGGTIALPTQLLSTQPITVNATGVAPLQNFGAGPPEFWANCCKPYGASPWLNTQPSMNDACIEQLVDNIAPYCPPGTVVKLELGDEHWNGDEQTGEFCSYYGNLMQFVSPNTVVNDYYETPASPIALNQDTGYLLIVAHHHDVAQARSDAMGYGLTIERIFGSQYTQASITGSLITSAVGNYVPLRKKIPIGSITIAPYSGISPNNTTMAQAFATTGTNPGSWSTALINNINRLYAQHASTHWVFFTNHANAIAPYGTNGGPAAYGQVNGLPTLRGYESGWTGELIPSVGAQRDMFYDPGPYPPYTGFHATMHGYLQALQTGDPRIPNSGFTQLCYQSLEGALGGWGTTGNFWAISLYQNQPAGDGTGNLYPTFQGLNLPAGAAYPTAANLFSSTQGGPAGDGLAHDMPNASIGLQAMLDWQYIAGGAPPSPPSASFTVKPTRIQPRVATPRTLTLVGTGTAWTNSSTVSVTNSVTGTTTVTAGAFAAISTTLATLTVTTAAGAGTFTITVDGVTSPILAVGARNRGWFSGLSRSAPRLTARAG